jgi:6-phosphogluconate dehydrogenase
MQLGMVGLGRMGANIVRRLMRDGHSCAGTDVGAEAIATLVAEGMTGAATPSELVAALAAPRTVWVMVPAGDITERAIADLAEVLEPGDTIIDGGNTRYHDDIRRAATLAEKGIHYLDIGTSGGVFGLERGFCLMVGGPTEVVADSHRSSPPCHRGSASPNEPRDEPEIPRPRRTAGSTAVRPVPATS